MGERPNKSAKVAKNESSDSGNVYAVFNMLNNELSVWGGAAVTHRLGACSSSAGSGSPPRSQTTSTPRPSAEPEPRHRGEGTGKPNRCQEMSCPSSQIYIKLRKIENLHPEELVKKLSHVDDVIWATEPKDHKH